MDSRIKILVTGAGGFTGRYLVWELKQLGFDVTSVVHRPCGGRNTITVDLNDPEFPDILKKIPAQSVVVHLGARIGWNASISRTELFRPNILATAHLADWSQRSNSYFIFASAALIAGEKTTYITSDSPLNTENDYLYGKWLAEEMIRLSGVSHAILRISGIFGLNGPEHLGINRAIMAAAASNPPVQLGDGLFRRNYIYVRDLCRVIIHCIHHKPQGVLLTAGTEIDTMSNMLQTICDILSPGQKTEIHPGSGGYDQIVEPSPVLPKTRSFRDAIWDINQIRIQLCV